MGLLDDSHQSLGPVIDVSEPHSQLNTQAFDCKVVANDYADIVTSLGIVFGSDVAGEVLLQLI